MKTKAKTKTKPKQQQQNQPAFLLQKRAVASRKVALGTWRQEDLSRGGWNCNREDFNTTPIKILNKQCNCEALLLTEFQRGHLIPNFSGQPSPRSEPFGRKGRFNLKLWIVPRKGCPDTFPNQQPVSVCRSTDFHPAWARVSLVMGQPDIPRPLPGSLRVSLHLIWECFCLLHIGKGWELGRPSSHTTCKSYQTSKWK